MFAAFWSWNSYTVLRPCDRVRTWIGDHRGEVASRRCDACGGSRARLQKSGRRQSESSTDDPHPDCDRWSDASRNLCRRRCDTSAVVMAIFDDHDHLSTIANMTREGQHASTMSYGHSRCAAAWTRKASRWLWPSTDFDGCEEVSRAGEAACIDHRACVCADAVFIRLE